MAQANHPISPEISDKDATESLIGHAALYRFLAPTAKQLGYDIVRIAWIENRAILQIMAEDPNSRQMTISDCVRLSQALSDCLDALEDTDDEAPSNNKTGNKENNKIKQKTKIELDIPQAGYRLEVSSPGIDRPLTRLADFNDWAGHEARITLSQTWHERKQFRGTLEGATESTTQEDSAAIIQLRDAKGQSHAIPLAIITSAKLMLTEALIATTAPLSSAGVEEWESDDDSDRQARQAK